MFDQVGPDDSERTPLRFRIMRILVVTGISAVLFGGLLAMTQFLD